MKVHRKHRLFIALLVFSIIITVGIHLLYRLNKPRDINILLITLDALRADHLGCYGYKRNTSPNIDKLAKEGVLFTQAISQGPMTSSAVPALLSSTYPSSNRIFEFKKNLVVFSPLIYTLPRLLKDKGYITAAISGHGKIFASMPGLQRGFDTVYDVFDVPADEITHQVIKWLSKNQDKRFFLWIHYYDPHAPYRPPPLYNRLFTSPKFNKRDESKLISKFKLLGVAPKFSLKKNMTKQDIDYWISQYDGEIRFVDEQIGILLKDLNILKLFKNTIIIITADHGENLYDRSNFFGHINFLYDVLLKVPLIIKCEKIIPKARIIDHQVQSIDIMPTILGILKVNTDIGMEGTDLLPLILHKKIKTNSYAFSEMREHEGSIEEIILCSVRTEDWKLIYDKSKYGVGYELYNLKTDPQELNNLVDVEKEQFKFLKAKLEEWMNRPKININPLVKPIDKETEKKLRALGYLH